MLKFCRGITKRILFIGFGIQIILGFIWMCFNFTHLQQFAVPVGILGSAFFEALTKVFPMVYLVQIIMACLAAGMFLKSIKLSENDRPTLCFGVLAFITFPLALQCHLAISPYSLASSFFLLELSFCLRLVGTAVAVKSAAVSDAGAMKCENGKAGMKYLVLAGGCWIVLSLLLEEYAWLGIVPIVAAALLGGKLRLRGKQSYKLTLAALFGIVYLIGTVGQYENIFAVENRAFSTWFRVCWSNMEGDSFYWDEEVMNQLREKIVEACERPSEMRRTIKSMKEAGVTKEILLNLYDGQIAFAWVQHKQKIVKETLWDCLGYSITPALLPLQLEGKVYRTGSVRNYEVMKMYAPRVTGFIVNYMCCWFCLMLLLEAANFVLYLLKERRPFVERSSCYVGVVILIPLLTTVMFYSLREAGMMDYKRTVVCSLMWIAIALKMLGREETL